MSLGTRKLQFSQPSASVSSDTSLNRRDCFTSTCKLGKYGLWEVRGDMGLIGGVSKGEESFFEGEDGLAVKVEY